MDQTGVSGKIIPLLFLFLFAVEISAQNVFICKNGTVKFYSAAPLENIEATCRNANSILNTLNHEIAFIVPIRSFKFEKALMQEHFNEKYLESDKYPSASFKGKINEDIEWEKEGEFPCTATGTISIHGVERTVTESGVVTVAGKEVRLDSKMRIALADFNISIPKLLFQNIADTVDVMVSTVFSPFEKKQ
jgi:hypothetical protein